MIAIDIFEETRPRPEAPFAAVFDPGFFSTKETQDVADAIREHPAQLLVFREGAATFDALLTAAHLPLEFLFFNTHGADDSILLGEQEVKSDSLVQWLALSSAPVVFNNSCLSWTGVGREFVRAGSRGYIGTLWPVGAESAAQFAAHVMAELVRGAPISAAISGAVVDDATFMAYIYAGTARACALGRNHGAEKGTEKHALAALESLLDVLLDSRDDLRHEIDRPLIRFLYDEVVLLFERSELQSADASRVHPLRLKQLGALVSYATRLPGRGEHADQVAAECLRLLDVRKLAPEEDTKERSDIVLRRGQIRQAYGDLTGAIADYETSSKMDPDGEADQPVYLLNLSDLLKRAGDWKRSKEVAFRAKRQADEAGEREVSMRSTGVLGQIERRFGNDEKALEYAREGFRMAVELKDRGEQAEFKLDEARALMRLQKTDDALVAANEAGAIARAASDTGHDLNSYGVIAQIHHQRGDAAASREYAQRGYRIAERLESPYEQASFLFDLGSAEELDGNLAGAVQYFGRCVAMALEAGRYEMLVGLTSHMGELAIQSRDWKLIHSAVSHLLALELMAPPYMRGALLARGLPMLKTAASIGPPQAAQQAIDDLLRVCRVMLDRTPPDDGWELNVTGYTLQMLSAWLAGSPDAAEMAAKLDQTVEQIPLDWTSFIATAPPQG